MNESVWKAATTPSKGGKGFTAGRPTLLVSGLLWSVKGVGGQKSHRARLRVPLVSQVALGISSCAVSGQMSFVVELR